MPVTVTDASTGSPARVLAGSILRSRLSFSPTTLVETFDAGNGSTTIESESLRNVYRSSRLKNENVTGNAYSTDAGGMISRPGASGNTI